MQTLPFSYVNYPEEKDKASILAGFLPFWLMCHFCLAFGGLLVLLALYWTMLALFPGFDLPNYWVGRLTVVSPGIAFAWMNHTRRKRLKKARAQTSALLGQTTFALAEEGLIQTSETCRATFFWQGITDIIHGPNGLLLMRGPLNCIAIPDVAFVSPAEMQAFGQAILTRLRDASVTLINEPSL